ncbi:DMT family transporter [Sphingobium sp. CFD-2]|uniref:DMT family transporter n=1 Tax=Sphingobium sp. CFD-2 TaxID=2878542 RepID=UPI00214C8B7D|nr:DMT family transporter [Sphingobium sp. CFD-2]
MGSRRNAAAYGALTLVMLLWAGNSIVGRAARDLIPPFTLAFVRWTGATFILLPFAVRHLASDWALLKRHLAVTLLLGIVGIGAFNALLYAGLHDTSATNGLLIQAAIPAMVLLSNRLIFGQGARAGEALGVAVSTLGVTLIILKADPQTLLEFRFGLGDALVLGAVIAWALYTSLLRLRPPVHPLAFLLSTFVIGILCMFPLAAGEWYFQGFPPLEPAVIGAFGYVATLPSLVAYMLFNAAVAVLGAARAGQTIALMPLFGAGLASLLLAEPLQDYHWAGMTLILAGISLGALPWRKTPASQSRDR